MAMPLLEDLNKSVLVEMTKRLAGSAGDYARLPKEHYVQKLGQYRGVDLEATYAAVSGNIVDVEAKAEANVELKPTQSNAPDAAKLGAMLLQLMGNSTDEATVRRIATEVAKAEVANVKPRTEVVVINEAEKTERKLEGLFHKSFAELLKIASARVDGKRNLNIWLRGPAGSGKTTGAHQVATALGMDFQANGSIATKYELIGYQDAGGTYHSTPFRKAWEHGGLYLFDEVDGSVPSALLAFNQALANGVMAFPDGMISRHPDTIIIAAANTAGLGATAEFIARSKLDAAFLDRFVDFEWDIDEQIEAELSDDKEWVSYVQEVRAKAKTQGLKVLITPRATVFGNALLKTGLSRTRVAEMTLRKSMSAEQWQAIK